LQRRKAPAQTEAIRRARYGIECPTVIRPFRRMMSPTASPINLEFYSLNDQFSAEI
jgi:hypothetical protein